MADINATDLTAETLATLDGNENVVLFDTAEGKKVTLKVLADYIVTKATESLMGSTQTVSAALSTLNSNLVPTKINSIVLDVDGATSVEIRVSQCGKTVAGSIVFVAPVNIGNTTIVAHGLPPVANHTDNQFFGMTYNDNLLIRYRITSNGNLQLWYGSGVAAGKAVIMFFSYMTS